MSAPEDNQKCTILIPPDNQVQLVLDTFSTPKVKQFVRGHILKESPLFLGQFVTEDGKHVREEFSIRSNKQALFSKNNQDDVSKIRHLEVIRGFAESLTVTVIHATTFYSANFNSYNIWHIDKCLHERHQEIESNAKKDESGQGDKAKMHPETVGEYKLYLKQFDENLYNLVQRHVQGFNNSYLLINGYHNQAVQKIVELYEQILSSQQYITSSQLSEDELTLKLSINSILIDGIFFKFHPFWLRSFQTLDDELLHRMDALNQKSMGDFGVPTLFQADQTLAHHILLILPHVNTPIEKLRIISKVIRQISETSSEQGTLTSDELVPILAYVVVQSKCPHLVSDCELVSKLQIPELDNTEYGFSLVSLQGALQVIQEECPELIIQPTTPTNIKASDMKSPNQVEPETLYRALTMPESHFKLNHNRSVHHSVSDESVEEMILKRKSMSSQVIRMFDEKSEIHESDLL
ncbi:hypothetical protein AKO1_011193 [Acrasis kona]|uniref:VPS9 domain-containing protein n=1 Tax=Acrasis kona TaxID=1008807 RepID=A0AAW2YVM8_9EUKA